MHDGGGEDDDRNVPNTEFAASDSSTACDRLGGIASIRGAIELHAARLAISIARLMLFATSGNEYRKVLVYQRKVCATIPRSYHHTIFIVVELVCMSKLTFLASNTDMDTVCSKNEYSIEYSGGYMPMRRRRRICRSICQKMMLENGLECSQTHHNGQQSGLFPGLIQCRPMTSSCKLASHRSRDASTNTRSE